MYSIRDLKGVTFIDEHDLVSSLAARVTLKISQPHRVLGICVQHLVIA